MSGYHYASCAITLGYNWCTCGRMQELLDDRTSAASRDVFLQLLRDKHWLLFDNAHNVTGCHCGFEADVDADCGHGDSVVEHLMDVSSERP